jgi:hypothetical protein
MIRHRLSILRDVAFVALALGGGVDLGPTIQSLAH